MCSSDLGDVDHVFTGDLLVPVDLPPGKYVINITAEDIAHNIGTREVPLEIW